MLQLAPAETFPIIRVLTDHTDSTTYYVRAVIKNASNDTVLATLDLTEESTRYFRYNWKVVWDNTMARGRFITITTSVYTTNAYSTKTENYGDEVQTYLVQERWDAAKMQSMGGGGGGLTTKDIRQVMTELLGELNIPDLKDIVFPKQKEYDKNFINLLNDLSSIKKAVGVIPTKETDLSSLVTKLENLANDIKKKEVTPVTDINPLIKSIKEAQKERKNNRVETVNLLNILERNLEIIITKIVKEAVKKHIPNIIQKNMEKATFSVPMNLSPQKGNIEELRKKHNL